MEHDSREVIRQWAKACERETVESGASGEDGEETGEVRELVAHFQSKGLETGVEEDLPAIHTGRSVALPHEVGKVVSGNLKDPLTWATALENWEDGGEDVVGSLLVGNLPHAVGVGQRVLPVGTNGHLGLQNNKKPQLAQRSFSTPFAN